MSEWDRPLVKVLCVWPDSLQIAIQSAPIDVEVLISPGIWMLNVSDDLRFLTKLSNPARALA
jgi:hypothetical protein